MTETRRADPGLRLPSIVGDPTDVDRDRRVLDRRRWSGTEPHRSGDEDRPRRRRCDGPSTGSVVAQSRSATSTTGRRRSSMARWTVPLVTLFICTSMSIPVTIADELKGGENNGCTSVRNAYRDNGFSEHDVPHAMISGEHLRTCSQGFTCCTGEMERKLVDRSRTELTSKMTEHVDVHRNMFRARAVKFNSFFIQLVNTSHRSLDDMFLRTYGKLFEQNAVIFEQLYAELSRYYVGGNVDVRDAVERFFAALMRRMIALMYDESRPTDDPPLSDAFLGCTTARINRLRPFGDVPGKMATQLQRAFLAARTFVHGLTMGRDALAELVKVVLSQPCIDAYTRMTYCSYCRGLADVKPCRNFCLNVLKGCFAHHASVDDVWNAYIDDMVKLGGRLKVPFNIENIVLPIDVKISEAIMTFQENSETIMSKVRQGCGAHASSAPRRQRRQPDSSSSHSPPSSSSADFDLTEPTPSRRSPGGGGARSRSSSPNGSGNNRLEGFIDEVTARLEQAKDVWRRLPQLVCSTPGVTSAAVDGGDVCWNGMGKSRYMFPVVGDDRENQTSNPEVKVNFYQEQPIIERYSLLLRQLSSRLRSAYNGNDVHWTDNDLENGSGSGDNDDDDDDDELSSGYSSGPTYSFVFISTPSSTRRPVEGPAATRAPPTSKSDVSGGHRQTAVSRWAVFASLLTTLSAIYVSAAVAGCPPPRRRRL